MSTWFYVVFDFLPIQSLAQVTAEATALSLRNSPACASNPIISTLRWWAQYHKNIADIAPLGPWDLELFDSGNDF